MNNNPYIVTKKENVKIYNFGNTSDGIIIWESENPTVTFYYVGVPGDLTWRRFLTEEAAKKDAKWLNERHIRILELSDNKLSV